MIFKALTEEDRKNIYAIYKASNTLGTEYCSVMLYNWMKKYAMEIAYGEGFIALRATVEGDKLYYPPMVKQYEKMGGIIELLEREGASYFIEITEASKFAFCAHGYKIKESRDVSEYLYLSEKLINLGGKKLHAKRNHISKFQSLYSYRFLSYEKAHWEQIKALLEKWGGEKLASNGESEKFAKEAQEEKEIILEVLNNLEKYNCFSDVLTVDNQIIGFSVGERLPTGVGAVYFEKADVNYEGAYSILNKLFCEKHFSDLKYVNRQEDMGDEGIRRAKLSYQPAKIYMKYYAEKTEIKTGFEEDVISLYKEAFPEDGEELVDFFFQNVFSPNAVKEIREEELISALHVVDKRLNYLDKEIKLPFIVGLATFEKYRGKGYAKQLLAETLDCMRLNDMPFVALYPAIEGFYEKAGFEKVFAAQSAAEPLYREPTSDAQTINGIYNDAVKGKDIFLLRGIKDTELRMKEEKGANLLKKDAQTVGYELYDDGGVTETCLTACAIDGPFAGMARILSLDKAFALLDLKGEYHFKLTDCLFEENNNIFAVKNEGVSLSEEYDFELTERELAGLFFGKDCERAPLEFKNEFPKSVFLIDKY